MTSKVPHPLLTSACAAEWGVTLDQAKVLQPDGGALNSKTYASSDDMVKAIDTRQREHKPHNKH